VDRIATLLDGALAAGLGSAAAVSVGDRGAEVFRHAVGHTHRVPHAGAAIDAHTPFDVASLTKPIATVACAMALVGDGVLDLDAPVARWLPATTTRATVRQLLGHAAGCAAHVELYRRVRAERPADPHARLVELAAAVACDAPGVRAVYSDLGFIQLGAVIERVAERPLDQLFADRIAAPLGLRATFPGTRALAGAVATELDDRGLVCGRVHDENAYFGGGVFGHAGLFASVDDIARFAAAIAAVHAGASRAGLRPDVVARFFADAPIADAPWRLGWDTPSSTPGISQAGDRWPRAHAVGHTGFTGTSLWLDLARGRWVALLTNRVHPTRYAATADAIKALRRAVNDAAIAATDRV